MSLKIGCTLELTGKPGSHWPRSDLIGWGVTEASKMIPRCNQGWEPQTETMRTLTVSFNQKSGDGTAGKAGGSVMSSRTQAPPNFLLSHSQGLHPDTDGCCSSKHRVVKHSRKRGGQNHRPLTCPSRKTVQGNPTLTPLPQEISPYFIG